MTIADNENTLSNAIKVLTEHYERQYKSLVGSLDDCEQDELKLVNKSLSDYKAIIAKIKDCKSLDELRNIGMLGRNKAIKVIKSKVTL